MTRATLILSLILLTGCSHRPSAEFRRELRGFLRSADETVKAESFEDLSERLHTLHEQWMEVDAAWPKGWHENPSIKLLAFMGDLHDAQKIWEPGMNPSEAAQKHVHEAETLLNAAHAELDDDLRE